MGSKAWNVLLLYVTLFFSVEVPFQHANVSLVIVSDWAKCLRTYSPIKYVQLLAFHLQICNCISCGPPSAWVQEEVLMCQIISYDGTDAVKCDQTWDAPLQPLFGYSYFDVHCHAEGLRVYPAEHAATLSDISATLSLTVEVDNTAVLQTCCV